VAVDWYPGRRGAPAAVFVPGLGSNKRGEKALYFAERFNAHGWSFLALDLRGQGSSDGSTRGLTMTRMLTDLEAALKWLDRRCTCTNAVLIGVSMGAAVSAWLAALQPMRIGSVVMIAPSLRFPSAAAVLDRSALDRWRKTGVRRIRNKWIDLEIGYGFVKDARQYAPRLLHKRYQAPTLILHGMADEVVPWRVSAEFAENCRGRDIQLFLFKDGDHRLTAQKELLFGVMWAWLPQQPAVA
jgi:alpha-beta hydrolase superfamily lysophospholipase